MIREAHADDSINLAALSIEVWLHTYARQRVRKEIARYVLQNFTEHFFVSTLEHANYRILVFIKEDHLVGYSMVNLRSMWLNQSNGYEIDKLYVQEHFQGMAIGRQLLAETLARYGGSCWLSTWVHNEKALNFYKHMGFVDIGQRLFTLGKESHLNRVLAFISKES